MPIPRRASACMLVALGLALLAPDAVAQTDYYNTDAGRPISTEDAYAIERRAFELQLAPLRLARRRGGSYEWGLEPEVAYGILPRTQIELGLPLIHAEHGSTSRSGIGGIHIAALHNLNTETIIPALALGADVLLPVGSLAPDEAYPSVKAIATKTLSFARFHANGRYTFGEEATAADDAHAAAELSRWTVGVAVDRAFPLRSFLLMAELVARQPIIEAAEVEWQSGAGMRCQVGPRLAADVGAGYQITGDEGWYVTFGAALALGLPWSPKR